MSPRIFYTRTFWRCPSCWVCFDSLQPVLHHFFLQLPFSPSSNLIPLRHRLRRFHHQSRWICSAEGPGTLITWCCHGVDESIAFKHVRWMALDGSWQSQATQKMYAGNPSRNVLNLVLESLWLMQIVYVSFTSCPRYPMSRATGGTWWIQRLSRSCHLSCALCKTQRIRRLSGMMWHHACLRMVLFLDQVSKCNGKDLGECF